MTDVKNIFGGAFVPKNLHVDPPEIQIASAMRSAGIEPPTKLEIDGQLHRFSTKGRKKDDSGWYVIFPDEPVAGRFGCWRDQIDCVFKAQIGRELTAAENMAINRRQAEAKAERDLARQKKAEIAASTVDTRRNYKVMQLDYWPDNAGADLRCRGIRHVVYDPRGLRPTLRGSIFCQ